MQPKMYATLTSALNHKESAAAAAASSDYWGHESRVHQSLYNNISQAASNPLAYQGLPPTYPNAMPMTEYSDQLLLHPASFAAGIPQSAAESPHMFFQGSPFLDSYPMNPADISQGLSYAYAPNGWLRPSHHKSALNNNIPVKKSDKPRKRAAFSSMQLKMLETQFRGSHFLTRERRMQIADELGITERQVKIWFQNRRMKWKKRNNSNTTETSGENNSDVTGDFSSDFKSDLDRKSCSDDGEDVKDIFSPSGTAIEQFVVQPNVYQHSHNMKLPVHL